MTYFSWWIDLDGLVGQVLALHAEEVDHRALVDHVPVVTQQGKELGQVRVGVGGLAAVVDLGRVHNLQVVDVDTDGEGLEAVGVVVHEDGVVRVVELAEVGLGLVEHPIEDAALKAAAGLWNAVDGLLDAAHERDAALVGLNVPGGHVTVDHLALEEGALEVGGDEVDAADAALHAGGVAEEDARRAVAEGRGERLVEVDA